MLLTAQSHPAMLTGGHCSAQYIWYNSNLAVAVRKELGQVTV
jgi:hypothetical protein